MSSLHLVKNDGAIIVLCVYVRIMRKARLFSILMVYLPINSISYDFNDIFQNDRDGVNNNI